MDQARAEVYVEKYIPPAGNARTGTWERIHVQPANADREAVISREELQFLAVHHGAKLVRSVLHVKDSKPLPLVYHERR